MWRIIKYLKHQLYLKHRNGHGIHSPYLFEVVHQVIFNASGTGVPGNIRGIHRELRRDPAMLNAGGPGAPSKVDQDRKRSVRSFARGSSVSFKYGALLYRISRWFKPDVILELGTGIGISTLYLASGSPEIPVHTIEGNSDRADFSRGVFKRSGLQEVKVHVGEMEGVLQGLTSAVRGRILVFMDGNHRFDPSVAYLRWILMQAGEEVIVVMDDIYWSRDMYRAWKEVITWPEVRMSIDLYQMGVLLLRRDLNKVDLKIKF
jgi:predicted O-methyltransferase YrrM